MRSLVKGYGDTHERGRAKFDKLVALLPRLREQASIPPHCLEGLIKAALADEGGQALGQGDRRARHAGAEISRVAAGATQSASRSSGACSRDERS